MDARPHFFHNLPSFTPLPNYTAWWQRHMGVNNLPKVVMQPRPAGDRTCDLLIASPMPYCCITMPPHDAKYGSFDRDVLGLRAPAPKIPEWLTDVSAYHLLLRLLHWYWIILLDDRGAPNRTCNLLKVLIASLMPYHCNARSTVQDTLTTTSHPQIHSRNLFHLCVTNQLHKMWVTLHEHSFHSMCLKCLPVLCIQCFDAVGWAAGRASGL